MISAKTRLKNARIVAEYWRDEMMAGGMPWRMWAHPLACVIGALDGETEPAELGIPSAEYERRADLLTSSRRTRGFSPMVDGIDYDSSEQ